MPFSLLLQQAARNSYRLDKCLYESLTIASSFNLISAYEAEMKAIKQMKRRTLSLDPNAYQSLSSIPTSFRVDDTILSQMGNSYLRYYLIEAASHVKNQIPEYTIFTRKNTMK
jgi:hypothetical protein